MKKKAFAILTLCMSLFAAVALVGCGGSGGATGSGGGGGAEKPAVDMRTDFIWFKVEVPEGRRDHRRRRRHCRQGPV